MSDDLNKLMAEKVRRWRLSDAGGAWLDDKGSFMCGKDTLLFTTDMNQAMMCWSEFNKSRGLEWTGKLMMLRNETYEFEIYTEVPHPNGGQTCFCEHSESASLAICQTIAKALEEK